MLITVMKRAVEKQADLYMCFFDFKKAIVMVRHDLFMRRLVRLGVDAADLRVRS